MQHNAMQCRGMSDTLLVRYLSQIVTAVVDFAVRCLASP
jgi:hypothetical protein